MPEGDTILRAARSLGRWLEGREITAARSQRLKVPADRLVGHTVESVEARAKHLLIRLSSGDVLHTHMRMTGSWHVYRAGERWRKPGWQARVVLEAGDRVAVCFDAPVVELLSPGEVERHPSIARLGPDVLVDPLDTHEVARRAAARPADVPIGDVLLDQRVVSGIGNIYRCESLFLAGLHPATPRSAVEGRTLADLVRTASDLMRANLEPGAGFDRRFAPLGGPRGAWVYGRGGRPCYRCRTPVATAVLGDPPRDVWWCPSCQPAPEAVTPAPAPGCGG
jgi:endonuclease VIII